MTPHRLTEAALRSGDRKRLNQAIDYLEGLLEKDPTDAELLNSLGALYLNVGQTSSAVETFRKLLEIHPDQRNALNNLAYSLARDRRF